MSGIMEKISDVLHGHKEGEDGEKHRQDKAAESHKEEKKHHHDVTHEGEGHHGGDPKEGLVEKIKGKIHGEGGDHKEGLVEKIKDKIHGEGGEHHGKDEKKKASLLS